VGAEALGIDHVYLAVRDLARSEAFYDRVMPQLGFVKLREPLHGEPHVHYVGRPFGFTLRPARPGTPPHDPYAPGLHHFCFRLRDEAAVDAFARALGAAGIEASPPRRYPEYAPDYYATFFRDPDGVRLEVCNFWEARRRRMVSGVGPLDTGPPAAGSDPGFTRLEAPGLVLRRFEPRDAEALAAYRSDPEVARHQGWTTCSLDEAHRFVAGLASLAPGTPGEWFQFAVSETPEGPLLGDCALRRSRTDPRQAELGFTFARAHQGRGLAAAAVRRLLDYAFSTLLLHRVFALVDERNERAQRLLARIGFREEGRFVENVWFKGEWASERLYALLEREWRAGQSPPEPGGRRR